MNSTWIVKESGKFDDMSVRNTVIKNGEVVGDMLYGDAINHVIRHGHPDDVYIEEYEGGLPSVTLTIAHVIDGEKKWSDFLQSAAKDS